MPLVSGVCRTASAPKPSHGGSRLNASKPEANPKTRCPTSYTKLLVLPIFLGKYVSSGCDSLHAFPKQQKTLFIESPFKESGLWLQQAQSISIITRHYKPKMELQTVRYPKRTMQKFLIDTKNFYLRPSPNERTCMGWHERHASLRRGSRGILRPEALNLEA